jgi:hypothetical protein
MSVHVRPHRPLLGDVQLERMVVGSGWRLSFASGARDIARHQVLHRAEARERGADLWCRRTGIGVALMV